MLLHDQDTVLQVNDEHDMLVDDVLKFQDESELPLMIRFLRDGIIITTPHFLPMLRHALTRIFYDIALLLVQYGADVMQCAGYFSKLHDYVKMGNLQVIWFLRKQREQPVVDLLQLLLKFGYDYTLKSNIREDYMRGYCKSTQQCQNEIQVPVFRLMHGHVGNTKSNLCNWLMPLGNVEIDYETLFYLVCACHHAAIVPSNVIVQILHQALVDEQYELFDKTVTELNLMSAEMTRQQVLEAYMHTAVDTLTEPTDRDQFSHRLRFLIQKYRVNLAATSVWVLIIACKARAPLWMISLLVRNRATVNFLDLRYMTALDHVLYYERHESGKYYSNDADTEELVLLILTAGGSEGDDSWRQNIAETREWQRVIAYYLGLHKQG